MTLPSEALPLIRNRLRRSAWFSGWPLKTIDALLKGCTIRRCAKSGLVYSDSATDELVLLLSGAVWTGLRSDADILKFGIAYPATLIGLSRVVDLAFHDEPQYEFYAFEDTEALVIPARLFLDQLNADPSLWRSIAQAAIIYQRHCIKLALVLYTGSTKDRLISAIYQFGLSVARHESRQPESSLRLPQEELAILIQSSRQHVNRALRELESDGLIAIGYRRITIVDPLELERRALSRFSNQSGASMEPELIRSTTRSAVPSD
jgi:CRP/FNR family transcriptional regulator, cyclic AMP receptor protein